MEKILTDLVGNVAEALKGENGPVYASLTAIVLVVCARYGYMLKSKYDGTEVTLEPALVSRKEQVIDADVHDVIE